MAAQAWTGCSLFVLLALIEALCGTHLMRLPVCEAAKLMTFGALSAVASSFYCFSMTRLEAPVALTLLSQYSWLGIPVQLVLDDRKLTHKEVSGLFATYGGQHSCIPLSVGHPDGRILAADAILRCDMDA